MSETNLASTVPSSKSDPALAPHKDEAVVQAAAPAPAAGTRTGLRFWLLILAVNVSLFLTALDYSAVSTALPTIVHDLAGDDFVWIGSAYALAATAFLPMTGGLAEIFGRRAAMFVAQALFALGSALCGSAQNMNWLIAARTIQGAGGGSLMAITSIVISDLVPLADRAMYNALMGLTWGVAAAIGPVVGGAFTQDGQWRWLFYMNLPIAGAAAALALLFMRLKTPPGSFKSKMARMDWIGNFLIIASTTACVVALSWGGIRYAWGAPRVVVPLVLGLVGIVVFLVYEARWAREPIVPIVLLSNRTTLSGYIQVFVGAMLLVTAIFFLPVYYQACLHAGPTRSGVDLFGLAMPLGPVLIATGASIKRTHAYRAQLWLAFALAVAGFGAMSAIKADSAPGMGIGLPVLVGVGAGVWSSATYFPVLAPLPVAANAHALALFAFFRSFACVWGVTIGTAVLQTQLTQRLPADFVARVPGGVSLAFALIPLIPGLEEPFRSEVRAAFADSVATIWKVMAGVAGAGLLASFAMRAVPLSRQVDEKWALEERGAEPSREGEEGRDVEMQVADLPR
ncbi:MFS general substrate transporter [Phanerochaete sordida]|uniref:MFS general substrate transporter n=1 Tax=Phanerochaete sordida TaxID=48140 RepID=A0A9P3GF33_9APHY|nr:MFS general substrate transporter [Phanerochaete sordida]